MNDIKIKDFFETAFSGVDGKILRDEIEKRLSNDEDVCLDFSEIEIFATMFFNVSLGYFVKNRSPEYCREHIKIKNISDLGRETYKHSLEIAEIVYNNQKSSDIIMETVEKNTED